MTRRRLALLAGIGALALAGSYPPFVLPVLSFVALAPAVLLVRQAERDGDARSAFRWGFWYGLAAHAAVLYWLIVALWRFTRLSALAFLATVLILGALTGAVLWFTVRVRLRAPAVPLWLVFPVAWTTFEWVVGHLGDVRFPWLGLGTSLADAPILVQWADVAGARGVTLWVAWCNVVIVTALLERRPTRPWLDAARRLAPVLATVALAAGYGWWRQRTLVVREVGVVGMVQPNVGYAEKWDGALTDSIMGQLLTMSRQMFAASRPALLIWPEAAIPGYIQSMPRWDSTIARFTRDARVPLLAGGLYARFFPDGSYDYYNAAFLYDSTGSWRAHPVYAKTYLVPIVERVPFVPPEWFGDLRFFGGFSRGRELPVYGTALGRFGVVICYESAFEDLGRRYRRAGADFLVNITNDAWYGLTSAPYQHESHLVLRAIETRMGIARAANSGITELLDPLGRRYAATRLETEAVVADRLRTSDAVPPYVRLGDWVGVLAVLATLGFAAVLVATRRS